MPVYPPHPPLAALLVLGGEDPRTCTRSRAALAYYQDCRTRVRPVPRLIVSGGARVWLPGEKEPAGLSEAEHMARCLLAAGVPPAHVWLEPQARDTLGNIVLGVDVALARGISPRNVVLVSDDFHLPRCRWLFAQVFGHAPLDAVGTGVTGALRLRWREPLALAAQRWALARAGVAAGDVTAHRRFVARQWKTPPVP
jgi:uncharacterized SAM-binding protein YcdF (DUF218 family)